MTPWERFKLCAKERWANFEAWNGLLVFIPLGLGFLYYANCDFVAAHVYGPIADFIAKYIFQVCTPANGYRYMFNAAGTVCVIWGIRKFTVNRIAQAAKVEKMISTRTAVNEIIAAEAQVTKVT